MTDTLAEHIKEELIEQYVKQHPDVSKSDVVTKCRNGQLVTDSVANLMQDIQSRNKVKSAAKSNQQTINEHINEYLCVEPDQRYKNCQQSVGQSKKLIDFLFNSTQMPFGILEKRGAIDFLKKREMQCAAAAREIIHIRKKLAELMESNEFAQSLLKTLVTQYLHGGADQLKSQVSIYNKEVELGNFYVEKTKYLIKKSVDMLKDNTDKKTRLLVRDVYSFLVKSEVSKLDLAKLDQGQLNSALEKYEQKLSVRAKQAEGIQMVVDIIEAILKELEEKEAAAKAAKKEKKPESGGNRMAFAKKLMGKFGF